MPKKIAEIRSKTLKPVPPEYLKDRAGPGSKRLHYVEGDYILFQLNEIFGVECVDISVPHIALESERAFEKTGDIRSVHKGGPVYEKEQDPNIPALEFSYCAKVRIEVTVLDDADKERKFVKEGIGAGTGSCNLVIGATTHQARQIAIKYAETDALKRAAKKLGSLFGLSIGSDGKQKYSMDEDDMADDLTPGPVTPAASSVLSNESTKPATSEPVNAKPATAEASAPKAPVPAPAATPVAAQTPQQAPKPAAVTPAAQTPVNAQQAPKTAATASVAQPAPTAQQNAPAAKAPADTGSGTVEIPKVDEDVLRGLDSAEWTTTFRALNNTLSQTTSIEDVSEIARIAGCYFRLVGASAVLDDGYKRQVKPLMTNYLQKHVAARALQIDIASEIKKGEEPAERLEEEAFQPPF